MIGTTLTHFRITAKLGEGAMGEVYEAEDTDLHRKVALKVLPQKLAANPDTLDRFKREARALAALNHPNIVAIYSVEQAGGTHFLTMELVQGRPLNDLIPSEGFSVEKLFALGIALSDALAAAHAKGISHRDLKPSNVMINDQGQVKVIDFGLAKLFQPDRGAVDAAPTMFQTIEGQILGTPAYMSPEQIEGRKVDHRTDIFSLGILLCEMATSRRPFKGDTPVSVMSSILRDAPVALEELKPGLPEHLGRIVRRCLQKDPDERYQSAVEVRNELKGLKEETSRDVQKALKERQAERIDSRCAPSLVSLSRQARQRWSLALLAGIMLALTGAAFYWFGIRQGKEGVSGEDSVSAKFASRRIESVAVLPFKNLVTDTNKFYFADMLTEEIIAKLGEMSANKNSALKKVPSAPMMMTYKATTLSPGAIARELSVDCLVAGSVALDGTRVSIRVQLIEGAQDTPIWSTNYVGDVDHIIRLRNEVALGISRAIHLVLEPEEKSRLTSARQVDVRALESYTRGKYCGGTGEDNLEAIRLFEEAVGIAPDFAAGHAALAGAYLNRYFRFAPQDHKQWERKALVALDTALRLDPDLADAHVTLGRVLWTPFKNFQHEEAMTEFQRAAKLNPTSSRAHESIAAIYLHAGLLDQALIHSERAAEMDRLSDVPLFQHATILLYKGEYEKSLPCWNKVSRDALPSVVGAHTAWAQFGLGQTNAAAKTIRDFLKEFPDDAGELTAMNAVLRAAAGDAANAEIDIRNAQTKNSGYGHFHHTAYNIAVAYALMNLHESALDWLEKTANTGFPCYPLFEKDPNLNDLRGTPGFVSFLSAQRKQWQARKDSWLKDDDLVKAFDASSR